MASSRVRMLAFGDSLTAGLLDGGLAGPYHPYGQRLRERLRAHCGHDADVIVEGRSPEFWGQKMGSEGSRLGVWF